MHTRRTGGGLVSTSAAFCQTAPQARSGRIVAAKEETCLKLFKESYKALLGALEVSMTPERCLCFSVNNNCQGKPWLMVQVLIACGAILIRLVGELPSVNEERMDKQQCHSSRHRLAFTGATPCWWHVATLFPTSLDYAYMTRPSVACAYRSGTRHRWPSFS